VGRVPGSEEKGADRIEIVLADDHALVRGGLRRVLESEADLTVVAEAGDVDEALRTARERQPRVVVLDLNMPGTSTVDAIPDFFEAAPGCAVLVLTMESEPEVARLALSAGADAYVLKDAAESDLVAAIRAVVQGHTYLDPSLGAALATTGSGADRTLLPRFDPSAAVGSRFAGHRLDAVRGRGGMGVVFRATDLMLDRTVALKLIVPEAAADHEFRARFERECRLAAAIDHPHAVQIFHAGEESGLLYLTMRYVDGPDLLTVLREQQQLDAARAAMLVGQLAGALDQAHRLGLVHRDIKPANVLLESRSTGEHAFLTDFGLTKLAGENSATRTAVPLGTVDYLAPEQANGGTVGPRADIYSLACMLFTMLTGHALFERDTDLAKLWAHVHEPPPALRSVRPDLPHELGAALAQALAKDPDERPASAGEFARAVAAAT
jgi:DNA-binding NarL/FixJ family response regulator